MSYSKKVLSERLTFREEKNKEKLDAKKALELAKLQNKPVKFLRKTL